MEVFQKRLTFSRLSPVWPAASRQHVIRISSLVSLHIYINVNELQRHLEVIWANLTPDPGPRTPAPSDGPKHMRTGWDMRRRWTTLTPPPTNSRRPVLTCPSRPGGRLACANVCRISFRRGESYEWRCVLTIRERGKKEKEFNANNTPGSNWICTVSVVCFEPVPVPDGWSLSQ